MGLLLLVDGSNQIFRAFHAMERSGAPRMTAKDGTPTSALHAFVNIVRKLIRQHEPTHVAVAFDLSGPTFRHEQFPEYKAQRDAMPEDLGIQFKLAPEALAALSIPCLTLERFEADDVIATLAKRASEAGDQVVIATADKDMLQLVGPSVRLHHTGKDKVLDEAGTTEFFGVPPAQVVDVLAIMGDASDNIPGVKGIGEKGAKTLVTVLGDIEAILATTDTIADDDRLGRTRKKMAKLLVEHADTARLARDLILLDSDAPLSTSLAELTVGEPDAEACSELFGKWGFTRLLAELGVAGPAEETRSGDAGNSGAEYELVKTAAELRALAATLKKAKLVALDTETNDKDPQRAVLVGISVSVAEGRAHYIPVGHVQPDSSLDLDLVREILGPVLADATVPKVLQNAKYDCTVLERHGLNIEGIAFDTMIASYLVDPARRAHGMDSLAADHLDYKTISFEDVAGKGDEQKTLDEIDPEIVARYAGEDADITLRLHDVLAPRIAAEGVEELFNTIEMPLVPVLSRMERTGIRLDASVLTELAQQLEGRITELVAEIHEQAGREFGIGSPKQLAEVLFDEIGLKPRSTTKTGARSTAADVLEQLQHEHPLPGMVIEYRELTKLKSTYVDALPEQVNSETGRIHTSYSQVVAATGRLSSNNPNLQNIPIRTELGRRVREAFVPGDGMVLIGADYSQVELRVMAHISEDESLCEAFARGEDIHQSTAARVFGIMPELVTDEMRRKAKEVNFGVLYGMGAFGLGQRLHCSRREAQDIIDRYFEAMPRVRATIDRLIAEVEQDPAHEARTLYGRKRALPDIASKNRNQRALAERVAVNTVVQGTAADLIKLAMIALDKRLREDYPEARMLLQVHDELILEAPSRDESAVKEVLTEVMEGVAELKAPLQVVAHSGQSWYELK